jgi:hypothetical protein
MTPHELDALLSDDGQRLLAALRGESMDDDLRVITRYRANYPADLVRAALTLTKLRTRARAKFSRADEMYFTAAGLEQASTERMGKHTAERFSRFGRVADLCSGIGGDLIALAQVVQTIAVDIDPVHLAMGRLNAGVYGVGEDVEAVESDVREFSFDGVEAAFVDPARRSRERRFQAGDCEPPLDWCFRLAERGISVGIKAAPGLPTDRVPSDWELEFVSEDRELKESVLWSPSLATTRRRATVLPANETLLEQRGLTLPVRAPGRFLIDPDPAVTRAGLVVELGVSLGDVWKIDEQVAFLSSDHPVATVFGRTLEVHDSMPWSLPRLKDALRARGIGTVDIRKRGSAVDVEEIQRRLKLTGTGRGTVVLTRVADKPWAFVCR